MMAPQSRPATLIGAGTQDSVPDSRTILASSPPISR